MKDSSAPDTELVRRVLAGSRDSFGILMSRHMKAAGAVAFGYVHDFQTAADVVQDSFVKAYISLHSLENPARFRSWLLGIVGHRAIDVLRRRKSKRESSLSTESGELDVAGSEPGPVEILASQDRNSQLRRCLARLPEGQRTVLALKYLDGMSYRDMAEVLELSESAVESRLVRARKALAVMLERLERD